MPSIQLYLLTGLVLLGVQYFLLQIHKLLKREQQKREIASLLAFLLQD